MRAEALPNLFPVHSSVLRCADVFTGGVSALVQEDIDCSDVNWEPVMEPVQNRINSWASANPGITEADVRRFRPLKKGGMRPMNSLVFSLLSALHVWSPGFNRPRVISPSDLPDEAGTPSLRGQDAVHWQIRAPQGGVLAD